MWSFNLTIFDGRWILNLQWTKYVKNSHQEWNLWLSARRHHHLAANTISHDDSCHGFVQSHGSKSVIGNFWCERMESFICLIEKVQGVLYTVTWTDVYPAMELNQKHNAEEFKFGFSDMESWSFILNRWSLDLHSWIQIFIFIEFVFHWI